MEFQVNEVFPTLIGQLQVPDAEPMNRDLQLLILSEESKQPTWGRSNIGGWHSAPDLLTRQEPAVAAFTNWLRWAVSRMVAASTGRNTANGSALLSAWATICRSGAYHAPHSHPDSAWSGVYYVNAGTAEPQRPLSGVLEFLDPRGGAEAVTAPGDPYGDHVRVYPRDGLMVIFPSWLYHWTHPYIGSTPRIAISFNAAVKESASQAMVTNEASQISNHRGS